MTDGEQSDERYCWVVILRKHGKVYTYIRTIEGMTQVIKDFRDKNGGSDPHRIWVIVDDEMQKVVIT